MSRRRVAAICSVWVMLALAGCRTTSPAPTPGAETPEGEAALAAINGQRVAWAACDPSLFAFVPPAVLEPVAGRLECATLKTALDWGEPERDTINLGVLRVRAADPAARRGALLLNPGGPGGDGLLFGALVGTVFASAGGTDAPAADLFTALSNSYDVVGFSPRGTGGSFRLYCGLNRAPAPPAFYGDRSPENVAALLAQGEAVAAACQNNPLNKYINTEQTVQDMDLIRRLLGDEKLNYLGYSYGSWLGSWYAKRFPAHAGNIVLDANTDFSGTFQDLSLNYVGGFERAFRDVALAYAARKDALYGLGATKEEVYTVYDGLPADLKEPLLFGSASIVGNLYSSALVPDVAVSLVAARGLSAVLEGFGTPTFENIDALEAQLSTYPYAADSDLNSEAQEVAVSLAYDYLFYLDYLEFPPDSIDIGPDGAVFYAVSCNDSPWTQDSAFWTQRGNEANETQPLLGGSLTAEACPFWSAPTAQAPAVPAGVPPILLVQNGYDAPTPSEGALRAFATLPNARLVYLENEMSHTAFPYGTACVDRAVASYLLDGTLPQARVTNCEARPLPEEAQVFPPGAAPTPAAAPALGATLAPVDNPLYGLVHDKLRENAAAFFGHEPEWVRGHGAGR